MRIDVVFRAIGSFSVRFRWPVLAAWIVAAVAIATFLPSLASVTQGNNANFLPASAPSLHAEQLAAPFGETNRAPIPVVAARAAGPLTAADTTWIQALPRDLRAVPTVAAVRELGVSPDGHAVQLQVLSRLTGGQESQLTSLVANLRGAITKAHPPAGLSVHLAGAIAVAADQQTQSGTTGNKVQYLSVAFIIVLLLLIFRSLLAPLITLAPAFLAVTMSGPLVAEAAHAGLKVSQLAQLLLIVLVLGAGTDYGLFLVFRTREQLRAGLAPKDAVVAALTKVGESITFSAATVVAALLSLLLATFQIYSSLGVPLAIGIVIILAAGLTLLPALLAIFGRAAFWPSQTRKGSGKAGVWGRVSARIVRRPAITLTVGLLLFGGLALASTGYAAGGFAGSTKPPAGSGSAKGTALLAKYFPTSSANPTNIVFKLSQPAWDDPGVLVTAQRRLAGSGLFTGLDGPLDPTGVRLTPAEFTALHARLGPAAALPASPPAGSTVSPAVYAVYRSTRQFVSPDGHTVMFYAGLRAGDPGTTTAMNAVPAVRAATARVGTAIGAADWGVAGEAPALYDISNISNSDMARVIPVAIIVMGLLLALVMRSLVAPLYLIASVGLSYLAALGLAVLLFIKIGGSGGLAFILPFLMFVFLLALGEDYNILVMSRIREEAHHLSLRDAVARALTATSTTVTSAGLVLAGTFGVFAIIGGNSSGGSQIRDVGTGLALGVLMDTFLVRTLLVPSTVVLLGRWNWWPSRMSRARGQFPGTGEETQDGVLGPGDDGSAGGSEHDLTAPSGRGHVLE